MRILLLCLCFLVAAPAARAAEAYLCQMDVGRANGWIPPVLFIGHDREKDRVVISDPITLSTNDREPALGRVAAENAHRITFVWEIAFKDAGGTRGRMMYRATYLKHNGEMQMVAIPLGFQRHFNAGGRCILNNDGDMREMMP